MNATEAVSIRSLRVERGTKVVIPNLDLSMPEGRITGLLGPSGCGKSTLLSEVLPVTYAFDTLARAGRKR